jgi:glucose/arabinose dehydrogenase
MGLLRALGKGCAFVLLGSLITACGGDDDSGGGGSKGGSGGTGGGGNGGTGGGTGGNGGTGGGTGGTGGGTGGGAGSFNCDAASGTLNLTLTEITTDLDEPVLAISPPGDPRLFVLEQHQGTIRIIENGSLLPEPFLTINGVAQGSEQGMLGLAFPADYATSGKFYVHYSAPGGGDTEIHQFTVSSDPNVADPSSDTTILQVDQPESNHNGGAMAIRDGMLFIGLGDGGGGGDQHGSIGNGQSLDTLLGKILRIDPNAPSGGNNYGIPDGNMTTGGALPEIWSYGLRNPWRWTFDACTGDMWIGDVGQGSWEEIDFEPVAKGSGTNWGWRAMEGEVCYDSGCDMSGKELPVAVYDHQGNCSVTGGYVYRGSAIPALRGKYIYADYCSANFWTYTAAEGAVDITADITSGQNVNQVSSFGQDSNGELYVVSLNGGVYRIDAE